jgi:hypothetical protein
MSASKASFPPRILVSRHASQSRWAIIHHSGVTQSRHWALHIVLRVPIRSGLAVVVVVFPNFSIRLFMSHLWGWSLSSWSCGESIVTGGGKKEEKERSNPKTHGAGLPLPGSLLSLPPMPTPSALFQITKKLGPHPAGAGRGPIVTAEVRRRGKKESTKR